MTAPYVYTVGPPATSTYAFSTDEGKPLDLDIATARDWTGSTFVLEVDDNSRFNNPRSVGTVTYRLGKLWVRLTQAEVDAIKDVSYRISVVRSTGPIALVQGSINYMEADKTFDDEVANLVMNDHSTTRSLLDSEFLTREEYISREVGALDPVVLDRAVQTRLNEHIQSPTPHPAYDIEMQDLAGLFENRLL